VKRALLAIAAAMLFLSTFAVPTIAHADGNPGGTNCGGGMCKP